MTAWEVSACSLLAGEKYTAYWKDEFGGSHISELPAANPQAIGHENQPTQIIRIHYQIERTEIPTVTFEIPHHHQYLPAKGSVKINVSIFRQTRSLKVIINTEQMAAGVMQVTIFDANMNPLAERVVFVNNQSIWLHSPCENLNW